MQIRAPQRFLRSVAEYIISDPSLALGLTIVLPNKRSAIFLRGYFKRCRRPGTIMPDIVTIGAFEQKICSSESCCDSRIELVMVMYKAYCRVMERKGQEPMTYDRFAFFGEMILDDFDDIDRSMADARLVYLNLERYNEIRADYLTPEQKEIIRHVLGDHSPAVQESDAETFWKHLEKAAEIKGIGDKAKRFLQLYQVLGDVYDEFNRQLTAQGMSYPGLTERRVTERIKAAGRDGQVFHHVAFVGFNRLSEAQKVMFDTLRDYGCVSFFWDLLQGKREAPYASEAYAHINSLVRQYPMPDDYIAPGFTVPELEIIGVPSNTLQTKECGRLLDEMNRKKEIQSQYPDNTAVVMPDPSLLVPMLHSLPDYLGEVNITMGLSLRETPFAALLRVIVTMHMHKRPVHGFDYFFYEDVLALVTNPQLREVATEACDDIRDRITRQHQFSLNARQLREIAAGTPLEAFFSTVDSDNPSSVRAYLSDTIEALRQTLRLSAEKLNAEAHQVKVLDACEEAVNDIFNAMERHNIPAVGYGTLFNMVEKVLARTQLHMSSTPIAGVQIMGVLETRALDFDNIILLSMNEGIFPRRRHMRTLIPQAIRKAYNLTTADVEEKEYAYYFYRLLSRSKKVICLYDSRTQGSSTGAMSRFLMQTRYLHGKLSPKYKMLNLPLSQGKTRELIVDKDEHVMSLLELYKKPADEGGRNLSASALKRYLHCPLRFYLEVVEGTSEDDEPTPYMDAITYGNVIHHVMQRLYNDVGEGSQITREVLGRMRSRVNVIKGYLAREINQEYYRGRYAGDALGNVEISKMPAEAEILTNMMHKYIDKLLETEMDFVRCNGPYTFVGAEVKLSSTANDKQWHVDNNLCLNVRMDIDRLDRLADGTLRFVDYKTGGDTNQIQSWDALFHQGNFNESNDAAFQLLFYAELYSQLRDVEVDVRPSLYRLQTAFKEGVSAGSSPFEEDFLVLKEPKTSPVIWSNRSEGDPGHKAVADEFRTRLHHMVKEIFNPDEPFRQADENSKCDFCPFIELCCRPIPASDR